MIPRPVRNNNPGDLEHAKHGSDWVGLLPECDMTPAQKAEPRFCVFANPQMGFRALVILLRNYQRLYSCNTIAEIVSRFAPPVENPTAEYTDTIAYDCGVSPDAPFDLSVRENMFKCAKAIARFETGSWAPYWADQELDLGIGLTGLYPAEGVANERP
jgi:hypothetical protein